MVPEDKIEVARALIRKAEEHLETARLALERGLYRDAISRAYYSAYSSASAVLVLMGHQPRTHKGLITMVGLHLVNTGLLSREDGKIIVRLYEMRESSDYEAIFLYGREDAEGAVSNALEFLNKMKELEQKMEKDLKRRYNNDSLGNASL